MQEIPGSDPNKDGPRANILQTSPSKQPESSSNREIPKDISIVLSPKDQGKNKGKSLGGMFSWGRDAKKGTIGVADEQGNEYTKAQLKAATKMQAIQRGHATRSRIITHIAATSIQKSWRGKLFRKEKVRENQLHMWEAYETPSEGDYAASLSADGSSAHNQSMPQKGYDSASYNSRFKSKKTIGLLKPINTVCKCLSPKNLPCLSP
jgi:hypothetical protein